MKKHVIAPQIVVYKNIFKNSKELINLLENDNKDLIFESWRDWYSQGHRKDAVFNKSMEPKNKNNEDSVKEHLYLKEICDAVDFIKSDYFSDFEKEKGVWPSFITNWGKVKENTDNYYIDYFRYDHNKNHYGSDKMLMDYHVDEFPILNQIKTRRHVITINFYLNDEYDGGEICAYDSVSKKSYRYKPTPGDAVVMPSTEPFYHGVKEFKGHNRYFLRLFVDYEVDKDNVWTQKYSLNDNDTKNEIEKQEDEYVKKDLQLIVISSSEEIVEIED
jgi:hypothetical protein